MKCYSSRPGEMNEPYMVPYSDRNWEDWFQWFTLQTGCEYTTCSGKQSNTQSRETGVTKTEEKLFTYTSAWSHTYSCFALGRKIAQLDDSDVKQICRCDSWMWVMVFNFWKSKYQWWVLSAGTIWLHKLYLFTTIGLTNQFSMCKNWRVSWWTYATWS